METTCPYCNERPLKRRNAKTCGEPECRRKHERATRFRGSSGLPTPVVQAVNCLLVEADLLRRGFEVARPSIPDGPDLMFRDGKEWKAVYVSTGYRQAGGGVDYQGRRNPDLSNGTSAVVVGMREIRYLTADPFEDVTMNTEGIFG